MTRNCPTCGEATEAHLEAGDPPVCSECGREYPHVNAGPAGPQLFTTNPDTDGADE